MSTLHVSPISNLARIVAYNTDRNRVTFGSAVSLLLRVLLVVAAILFVPKPATSLAAVGDLTGIGCIEKAGSGVAGCTSTGGNALGGARGVAVSPDGQTVYVTSAVDNSISVFARAPNGDLTGIGCIEKAGSGVAGCTSTGGNALGAAWGVAVSPDGQTVYVTSFHDDSISVFDRMQ